MRGLWDIITWSEFFIYLLTRGLICEHMVPQLNLADLAHIGFSFADAKSTVFWWCPHRKSASVRIAWFGKVRQVICHLLAKGVIFFLRRPRTSFQSLPGILNRASVPWSWLKLHDFRSFSKRAEGGGSVLHIEHLCVAIVLVVHSAEVGVGWRKLSEHASERVFAALSCLSSL